MKKDEVKILIDRYADLWKNFIIKERIKIEEKDKTCYTKVEHNG